MPLGQGASEKAGTPPTSTYTVLVFWGSSEIPGMLVGIPSISIFLAWAHLVAEQKKPPVGPLQKVGAEGSGHGSVMTTWEGWGASEGQPCEGHFSITLFWIGPALRASVLTIRPVPFGSFPVSPCGSLQFVWAAAWHSTPRS